MDNTLLKGLENALEHAGDVKIERMELISTPMEITPAETDLPGYKNPHKSFKDSGDFSQRSS